MYRMCTLGMANPVDINESLLCFCIKIAAASVVIMTHNSIHCIYVYFRQSLASAFDEELFDHNENSVNLISRKSH